MGTDVQGECSVPRHWGFYLPKYFLSEVDRTDVIELFYRVFLGPRGPLVLPLVGPVRPVRPVRAKNLDHLYTGIYAL